MPEVWFVGKKYRAWGCRAVLCRVVRLREHAGREMRFWWMMAFFSRWVR